MTQVHLQWEASDGAPTKGLISFTPTKRTIDGYVLITDQTVTKRVNGAGTVNLRPSAAGTAYRVVWNPDTDDSWEEYVLSRLPRPWST